MRDTRESQRQAQAGLAILQRGFRRYEQLVERADALSLMPGSSLDMDRDAASYNPVSDLVENALGTALDHLHGLKVSVESSGGVLLAMSSFTLIRTALEVAGTGLWILQPGSRDERLLRSRQVVWSNRRQLHIMQVERGSPDIGFARAEARLREQLDSRPALKGRSLTIATVTSRLTAIEPMLPGLAHPPLTLWRMASGIAHGNTYVMYSLLEREQTQLPNEGSVEFEVTTSFTTVALFYEGALEMIESLLDLFDAQNVPVECR